MLALTDATDLKTSGSLDTDIVRNGQVLHLGGTLRRHNGRRWQWERHAKKAIVWIGKTTTLHVQHAFLYTSLPSLHDYDGKMPNLRFMEDVNKRRAKFLSLSELEYGS